MLEMMVTWKSEYISVFVENFFWYSRWKMWNFCLNVLYNVFKPNSSPPAISCRFIPHYLPNFMSLKKIINYNLCCPHSFGYVAFHCSIVGLSRATSSKKIDSLFPSRYQLPVVPWEVVWYNAHFSACLDFVWFGLVHAVTTALNSHVNCLTVFRQHYFLWSSTTSDFCTQSSSSSKNILSLGWRGMWHRCHI